MELFINIEGREGGHMEGLTVLTNGEKLYHYTSAAGLKGIVDGEFWVTESQFLNDINEFQMGTEVYSEVIKKHIVDEKLANRIIHEVSEEVDRLNQVPKIGDSIAYSGYYVISFSLEEDSLLLWSEYSECMGYCMKFDFQKLFDAFNHVIYHGKVIYDWNKQIKCIEDECKKSFFNAEFGKTISKWEDIQYLTEDQWSMFVRHSAVICLLYGMFFKKKCFEGEKEYRFIFDCIHEGGKCEEDMREKQHFRIKDETFIPYVKQKIKDLDGLERVMVGPKNQSDIALKGLERYFRNRNLGVEVKMSKASLRY